MDDLAALARAARDLLPQGHGLGVADPRAAHPAFPGETVAGVAKRQSEFRAGRHAARAALAELGLPGRPIPAGADRAPIWPLGLIGSISHSDRLCLAAVGRGRGIGVDLEPAEPLEPQIHRMILSPEDRGSEGAVISGLETRLIFSAKEAAYKAQYPLSRQLFDFQTLAVTVQGDRFEARFRRDIAPFTPQSVLQGRWAQVAGHFLCVVAL